MSAFWQTGSLRRSRSGQVAQWLSFRNGQGHWRGRLSELVEVSKNVIAGTGESDKRKGESGPDFRKIVVENARHVRTAAIAKQLVIRDSRFGIVPRW